MLSCVLLLFRVPLCRAMAELLKTAQLLPRRDAVSSRSRLLENVKKAISSSARRFSGYQQHVCISVSSVPSNVCEILLRLWRNSVLLMSVIYWLCSFSNVDRSRYVRRDRSSSVKKDAQSVKKNTQIFLVVVGMFIFFASAQSATDHTLLNVNKLHRHPAAQMAKSDFIRCIGADIWLRTRSISLGLI